MERDIKRAKGADELPVATMKENILREPTVEQLEAELAAKNATIERLTRENEELQQKLKNMNRAPLKKGAQTRYWRKEEHERFLEALEKYGQRDVKNISAFVGTRSPTQVRTHAQKYFLKQRREESAQMKSANMQARKRRAAANADEEEDEELEEYEEDEEAEEDDVFDDDENGMDITPSPAPSKSSTPAPKAKPSASSRTSSVSNNNNAASNATTIKLKTQDVVAHSSSSPANSHAHGTRASAAKRSTTPASTSKSHGKASGSNTPGAAATSTARNASTSSPSSTNNGSNFTSTTNATTGASSTTYHSPTQRTTPSTAGKMIPGTSPQNQSLPSPYFNPYSTASATAAAAAAAAVAASPYGPSSIGLPNPVFYNNEEASIFFKAVRTYERETDRAKVLSLIREYFLPHRSVEEISNMVDYAFPSDPSSTYNTQLAAAAAAAAAAASFHPMAYAQRGLYYPDSNTASHVLPGSSFVGPTTPQLGQHGSQPFSPQQAASASGASSTSSSSSTVPTNAVHGSIPSVTSELGHATPSTQFLSQHGETDFATHVDSAALNSLSERLTAIKPKTESDTSINNGSITSGTSAGTDSFKPKPKEEDDDLSNELATLTDHRANAALGGGLGGLLGRPVALSPIVFGTATPLGFTGTGMTPLMSTPLPGFMSPIINFTAQSPLNPFYGK